jgi:hypothetical protein
MQREDRRFETEPQGQDGDPGNYDFHLEDRAGPRREPDSVQGVAFHPASYLFPMMSEAETSALAANIEANGLQDGRIETLDGMLLDGRNRARALDRLGVDIKKHLFALSDNTDPRAHVISKNRCRKQHTDAHIAFAGLALANSTWGGPGRSIYDPDVGHQVVAATTWTTTYAEAARRVGIHVDQINRAAAVRKAALPGIMAAIKGGKIKTIWHAYGIITPDRDEKIEGLTSKEKQERWLKGQRSRRDPEPPPAKPITNRMVKALTQDQLDALAATLAPRVSAEAADDLIKKLAPKANRAAAQRGKRWAEADL